jgi:hypothetical protein
MSGPSSIKVQKTGAEEIGNGPGRSPLLILSVSNIPGRDMSFDHVLKVI